MSSLADIGTLTSCQLDVEYLDLRYFEQAVHELGRSPVHLDVESLDLAGEVVEGDDGRDRDEDAQGRRDQGLSDAARNHRHSAGPRGSDVPESVDDSDHGAEETDERSRRADRSQEPETAASTGSASRTWSLVSALVTSSSEAIGSPPLLRTPSYSRMPAETTCAT